MASEDTVPNSNSVMNKSKCCFCAHRGMFEAYARMKILVISLWEMMRRLRFKELELFVLLHDGIIKKALIRTRCIKECVVFERVGITRVQIR